MMAIARKLLTPPGLLALASLGLGGLVALQLRTPPEVPAAVSPEASIVASAPDEAAQLGDTRTFSPRPIETYAGIEARPLFMSSRRPQPPSAPAAGGQSGHDSLMLAGVILMRDKRIAMIETKRTAGVAVVHEGESVEGWRVDEIAADRVVISQNADVFELLLDDKLKAPRREVRRTPRTQPLPQPVRSEPAADAEAVEEEDEIEDEDIDGAG